MSEKKNNVLRENVSFKELKKARDLKCKNLPIEYKPLSKISPYVSYFLLKFTSFTPNQVSFIWGVIGLISVLIMSLGGYWNLLIGILLYHFAVLLDYVDGDMSRAIKKTTLGGTYLDFVFSWMLRALLMLGLGIGLYNTNGNVIYFYLGIWTSTLLLLDNINKLKVHETLASKGKFDLLKKMVMKTNKMKMPKTILEKIKFYGPRFLTPNGMFSLLFFSIVFNVSQYYLILMSVIIPLFLLRNFREIYKSIGNVAG
ncbi:MAG: CDP-alcohol phosphatidyltransferase family protein [Nanoarchaeota archaeon]|nr:CDP-alcohol phosphatidyltransferase family protein [Nanoarchaeota archaeon]